MKKSLLATVFLVINLIGFSQPPADKMNCNLGVEINHQFSKAVRLDSVLKSFSPAFIPGAAMAVYSPMEGWWAGAAGYANLEKKEAMENCHLQYLQSITKSYLATAILQLREKGKINLDEKMTKYLPVKYSKFISNADQITIRMLLNHTSGVPEYNSHPLFVSRVMEHPLENFTQLDCLKAIANEKPVYAPGSKYAYTNTNYLLLSLIVDAISGDHAAYIRKNIFEPLGLTNSYYALDHQYLKGKNVPDSYWDVFNSERPAQISGFQQMTVVSSKGDDGLVCTPIDAIKYLKGLMEGKLVNPESLALILDFVKDEKGNKRYGMGMIYFDLGGIPAYGHGGGGVGAGCGLLYVPSHKMYIFFAANIGVLLDGKLPTKAGEMRDSILATLLQ